MAKIKKYVLSCGLPVYFCVDNTKHQVYCDLYVRFGGAFRTYIENGKKMAIPSGIAHLIEHYLCERGKDGNLIENLGPITLSCNATTWPNKTAFYFHTLPKYFEEAFKTLAKNIFHPCFSSDALALTKPAILEECRIGSDSLARRIYKASNQNLFLRYNYENGIGTEEEVKSITIDDVKRIYKTFYTSKNMVLFLGGNLDIDKTIAFLEKTVSISIGERPKLFVPKEPIKVAKNYEVIEDKASMTEIHMYFKMPLLKKVGHLKKAFIDIYEDFIFEMNFSNNSALAKELSDNNLIVGYLKLNYNELLDIQTFSLSFQTHDKEKAIETILNYLKNGLQFDEELFQIIKRNMVASFIRKTDYIENEYSRLVHQVLNYENMKIPNNKDILSYNKEDCCLVMKELCFSNYTIIEVIPKAE